MNLAKNWKCNTMKITFIIGTRPELIKVAPVIWEARNRNIDFDVVNTAQHKDLLTPYWSTFDIEPTHTLDVMRKGQSLTSLTSRAICQIQHYLNLVEMKPDLILAQGDTTTVMAASMVSFFNKIKFAHLEAGLRSFDFQNPFPEEYNRRVAAIGADYHFAPTKNSKDNLLNEGIDENKVFVVGNTVVDALNKVSLDKSFINTEWENKQLEQIKYFEKSVLITCHRRENQGENLQKIITSINILSTENPTIVFVWTLHPNPNIRQFVLDSELSKKKNVLLIEPLSYFDILKLLKVSLCVISDSGGIQEEAPSFQTPVLVLRKTTERPEGVNAGLAFLVGTDQNLIVSMFNELINNKVTFGGNPYGDGKSSAKILDVFLS